MTFLSGFQEAFTQQYNKRQDREAELENTKFKYGLDALMQKKELRTKKQAQESEWSQKAKSLANSDPDLSTTFYKELANGVDYETLQKRHAEGAYVKNDKWVAPDQIVKMPTGVAPAPVRYDEGMQLGDKTTQRIKDIDPELLEGNETPNEFTSTGDSSPYTFQPTKEIKVGDYADSIYKLSKAKETGDPVQIRDAELQLRANQEASMAKAEADAKAKGEGVRYFAIKDKDGNIGSNRFQGELREVNGVKTLWNVSNPMSPQMVEAAPEDVVGITPEQNKVWRDVSTRFDKSVADYNTSVVAYGSFANTSAQIRQIYAETPEVVSNPSKFLNFVNGLSEDVQHAISIIDKQAEGASTVAKSGDKDVIASEGAKFMKAAEDAVSNIEKSSTLSPANKQIALNYAKYKSLMVSATMQAAASYGIGGANMANKEFDRFNDMLQGSTGETLLANLDLIDREIVGNLYATEQTMDTAEVRTLAGELGVKGIKDLSPRRVGDVLASPELRARYDATRKQILQGSNAAATGAEGQAPKAAPKPVDKSTWKSGMRLKAADGSTVEFLGGDPNDKRNYKKVE